jgi:phosphoribosyl 1,2-cyclic phosphodiesterase
VAGHRIKIIRPRVQFQVGTWAVLPFDVVHDAADPLGFLLANRAGEKLLYLTDTAYCKYRFNGLSHILIEVNYSIDILRANVDAGAVPVELKNRLLKSHMSLETVKEFLRANDLSRVEGIWLLHLSDGNSDAERFKKEIMELAGKPTFIAPGGG